MFEYAPISFTTTSTDALTQNSNCQFYQLKGTISKSIPPSIYKNLYEIQYYILQIAII